MFSFFRRNKKKQEAERKDIELFRKELEEREAALEAIPKESKAETMHFELMELWKKLKEDAKEDESVYPYLIEILKEDCAVHDQFVKDYYKRLEQTVSYPAFKELALAYERTNQIQKAIDISKEAIEKEVNEGTSFENRIKRLKKKL